MAVKLTSGAITKISNGEWKTMDLKPVLQVMDIRNIQIPASYRDYEIRESYYVFQLSDGAFHQKAFLSTGLDVLITSHQLLEGSIVQLADIAVREFHVIHDKCDIIGDPKPFPRKLSVNETPSLEVTKPIMHSGISNTKEGPADPDVDKDVDDSSHAKDPPADKQKPLTATQTDASRSQTKNRKRKRRSSNHKILAVAKDISKIARMIMEKNREGDIGACIEKLDELGWGTQDPLYDTALLLFGESAEYRKLWLHLKPESCEKWVKNAGVMFGLLD